MKNKSQTNMYRNVRSEIFNKNNSNSKVRVDAVKSWKDDVTHDKIRRQRQDLFDRWGEEAKSHIRSNS